MEVAWVKGIKQPMYVLSKTQSLYIGTKFNDQASAKLIIRFEKLENGVKVMSTFGLLLESVKYAIENECLNGASLVKC